MSNAERRPQKDGAQRVGQDQDQGSTGLAPERRADLNASAITDQAITEAGVHDDPDGKGWLLPWDDRQPITHNNKTVDAERRAGVAYREVLATYGMRAGDPGTGMRLRVGCPAEAGSGCAGGFGPGAEVEVEVTYRVPVARVPFLGAVAGPGVTVGATHHTRVDRYRGLGG